MSASDGAALIAGALVAAFAWPRVPWAGLCAAYVVVQFFLFCNVLRVSRALELAWIAAFLPAAASSGRGGPPGWPVTIGLSLAAAVVAAVVELRKPSYHGVGWSRVNPGLRAWWDAQAT